MTSTFYTIIVYRLIEAPVC